MLFVFLICLLFGFKETEGQTFYKSKTILGAQISGVFPSRFIENNEVYVDHDTATYFFEQKNGMYFGMEIRHELSPWFALEYGINLVKRNYSLTVDYKGDSETEGLGILYYEGPFSALVFIQLSKKIFMNASVGYCSNYFPSDLAISNLMYAKRKNWVLPSLTANIGFELRTEKMGYIYLGCTYNRFFDSIYRMRVQEPGDIINSFTVFEENGSYFSVNLKYYFNDKK